MVLSLDEGSTNIRHSTKGQFFSLPSAETNDRSTQVSPAVPSLSIENPPNTYQKILCLQYHPLEIRQTRPDNTVHMKLFRSKGSLDVKFHRKVKTYRHRS